MSGTPESDVSIAPFGLDDVRAAADALRGVTLRTPVFENLDVNEKLGGRLLLKAEHMQRTGAFKIRGAYWRMVQMTAVERAAGVLTYSSGNHALGVAKAAELLGTHALIVMPDDASDEKVAAVRALGADVVTYERDTEDYNDVVEALRLETGRIHVPPSAHPKVLEGSGTVALELFDEIDHIDVILTPCGSGGLTASTAVVARTLSPSTELYAVEPETFDDTCRSLAAGERVPNPPGRRTICDSIMTPIPNAMTFPINHALLTGGLAVSDDAARRAMRFAYEHYKTVVEPGGAVGLAAVLEGKVDITGRTVATVITGGNIDTERFAALLAD